MDKPKHNDGMLAAGKKRLEQFRQKKQGKGSYSKQNKPETDIEHGRRVDEEHVSSKGCKSKSSMKCTSSDDLEAANNRSDIGSYEVPIDLVARADDTVSQISTEHSSASDLSYGSAHSLNPEENALEQYSEAGKEKVAIGNSEFFLRIDSLGSSGLHLSNSSPITETPTEQGLLVGVFDSGRVSLVPDLSISMTELAVPDINLNHDLVNNGDGATELSSESVVMNSSCSDNTQAVQPYDKEQELMSSLESGATGMPLCSSTIHPVSIAETSSEHDDEKASELHNQEADFTGGHDLNNGAVPDFNTTSVNLECVGGTSEVMNKEQTLSSSSDSEAGTDHLTDSKSEVGFDAHVARAVHLAVSRPEVDLPPVSEAPNGAHALESHIEDIILVSDAVESSNREQPGAEELIDINSESVVKGTLLDSSLNQAEVGLNNDSGFMESSDDSYQGGMPIELTEDMASTSEAEEPTVLEVSEPSDDLVQSDLGGFKDENTVVSSRVEDIILVPGAVESSNKEQPGTEELNNMNSESVVESHIEDIILVSDAIESSNREQLRTEELTGINSESVVRGMPLDWSLNQAEVGLNNDSGFKESSDDSYQGGRPVARTEEMASTSEAEEPTVLEVSEPSDDFVRSDSGALEHENTVLSLHTGESTANSLGIGEDATSVTLMADRASGELSLEHVSDEGLSVNIVLNNMPETNSERGSIGSGLNENIEVVASTTEEEMTYLNTDKPNVSGTAVQPEEGAKETVHVEGMVSPIQESLFGDGLSCSQIVEAEQTLGEDKIMSLIEGENTGIMKGEEHCPSKFEFNAETTSNVISPEEIVALSGVQNATADSLHTNEAQIPGSDNDSGFSGFIMDMQHVQDREAGEEKVAIGNSEFCLRIDSLGSSGLHLSSSPPTIETPIEQGSLVGDFDSGRVSVVPDLSICMADLAVPDINVNHDLVNNGDGTTELSRESAVMNYSCSDNTEAVQPYDKEQELMSSLGSGATGMPLCSSTNQPVSIAETSSSEHDDECVGIASEVMNKEQTLSSSSDSEAGTVHLTDSKSKSKVGFDAHVAGATHLAVLRSEVDLPPVSEAPSGAHTLKSHIEDIIVVSGAVESSNKEQPRTEEPTDINSECVVRGMPLDSSLNQAEIGLHNDSGFKESSDDSYQGGMPVARTEDMTTSNSLNTNAVHIPGSDNDSGFSGFIMDMHAESKARSEVKVNPFNSCLVTYGKTAEVQGVVEEVMANEGSYSSMVETLGVGVFQHVEDVGFEAQCRPNKMEPPTSSGNEGHYETVCREGKDLLRSTSDADAACEVEVKNLKALLLAKEAELAHVQEKVDFLSNEIRKTKEDGERKVQEAEHKVLGVRERLSLAVTKGKGLVQQRDNLKQVLAEKTAELEASSSSYSQELHAMKVALNEAEGKVKLNSEAVERVEALEFELSYIRNSANALRESFLQKDAVLQKIEELLEDANLPEELQIKDINEKVEWLLEAYTQQTSVSEGQDHPETVATRGMGNFSVAEQASQMQEIEQLNRKCDELLRKYRDMAEQSAMLEQSLLERNLLIQRWEEMLDAMDMPAAVRSKEPDEKIEWLGTAVSDAHTSIAHLQAETESLQTTVDTLNHALQKLQEENSVLSVELVAKDEKLRTIALDLEDMTLKYSSLSKPTYESSNEIGMSVPQAGLQVSEESECKEEASQQQQFQIEDLEAFVTNIRTLLSEVVQEDEVDKIFSGVPASTAFETSVKLLVENSKVCSAEVTDTKGRLAELTSAMSVAENDQVKELQSLHEALSLRTLELSNLTMQLEGLATKNTLIEDEVDSLQEKIKVKSEELACTRDELNKSQLEVTQGEDKLASVKEKLSMAVRKGKSVVQQRDTLKQSIEEKTAEISQLRKEQEAENLALTKAKQSLKHQSQQMEMLEAELSSSRNYASSLEKSLQENNRAIQKFAEALDKIGISGAPRSGDLTEKIQWISQLVFDLQRKAGISEQEAKKSKKATELLALELEEVQGRMDSLADELMHAEKNISLLIEEKKSTESSKAEAGLRLEHAMANINSLLFELSESRETQANLEQENNSLKDSLSVQMDEIRYKQTKAEDQLKELTHLYNKVHALKANQSNFLDKVADQVLKSSDDIRGTKALVLRISGELQDQGLIPLPTAPAFVESSPSTWQSEMEKTNQGWKQGVTTGSLKLLCEEMEMKLQHFDNFFKSFVMAWNQDSEAMSQMLLRIWDGLGPLSQMMQTLKTHTDFAMSTESLILQKDEQIKVLVEVLKAVAEKVRSSVEEMEVFEGEAQGQVSRSGTSIPDASIFENLLAHTVSLVERLSSSAKDLACSRQQNEKQKADLRNELRQAKAAIDVMDQQQQKDKLKISKLQKCMEDFEVKEGMLERTNQELYSLHDVLSTRKQEEEGLVEALNKAETKIGDLSAKVEELEKAKQELEASLGKASSRFYTTVNNFSKFQSLSEKLIEEAESLHLLLEDRDAQIALLKEEVTLKGGEVTSLQNLVHEKTSDLSQLCQQIGGIVSRDAGGGEPFSDLGLEREPGSRKELLEALATSVQAGTEGLRMQLARKDALLQDFQLRHDDLTRKVTVLESSLLENQRLMEERGHANVAERMMISVEAEEKGNRGKHVTPSVAVVTHGRGGRKVSAASDHLALDVDTESSRLLVDVDDEDKGHIFKPLTSSRLVPRGTRILVDRLDGFWVSGERLLRRRPGARLSVMLYWLVLHIWMAAILL